MISIKFAGILPVAKIFCRKREIPHPAANAVNADNRYNSRFLMNLNFHLRLRESDAFPGIIAWIFFSSAEKNVDFSASIINAAVIVKEYCADSEDTVDGIMKTNDAKEYINAFHDADGSRKLRSIHQLMIIKAARMDGSDAPVQRT